MLDFSTGFQPLISRMCRAHEVCFYSRTTHNQDISKVIKQVISDTVEVVTAIKTVS